MYLTKLVKKWESEGYLLTVPEDLKVEVALILEKKQKDIIAGTDYKDQPEDYESVVNEFLDNNFKI